MKDILSFLEEQEKRIEIQENYARSAEVEKVRLEEKISMLQENYQKCNEELKELGIDIKDTENDIIKISKEIEQMISKVEELMPVDAINKAKNYKGYEKNSNPF